MPGWRTRPSGGSWKTRSELARLDATLPPDLKADWLTRRLRNHTVNLGLLDMAARGQITSLRLTSDDTSPLGFPSRERDWLGGWPRLIGPALIDRVMMHPGADEVGSALLSHLLMARAGKTPRVGIVYSHPGDDALVAPYEDRPVCETVEGQVRACGCSVADGLDDCDFLLGVATPSPRRTDYRPEYGPKTGRSGRPPITPSSPNWPSGRRAASPSPSPMSRTPTAPIRC